MRIFISYSHQDNAFVTRLTGDLKQHGLDVWIDQSGIRGGDAWRKAIVEGIDTCDAFIAVLSPNYTASRNVAKELSIADEHGKRILPVICEPCQISTEMEYPLTGLQWLDFSSDYDGALGKLLVAVGTTPSPKPSQTQEQQQPQIPRFSQQPQQQQTPQEQLPGTWLAGTWQLQYRNMATGASGYGQFTFLANGAFTGQQMTPYGLCQINAMWRWLNQQMFAVQGTFVMAANPYAQLPFNLVVQVVNVGPGTFTGMSETADQIEFRRTDV
jgi:hypothetical protein